MSQVESLQNALEHFKQRVSDQSMKGVWVLEGSGYCSGGGLGTGGGGLGTSGGGLGTSGGGLGTSGGGLGTSGGGLGTRGVWVLVEGGLHAAY